MASCSTHNWHIRLQSLEGGGERSDRATFEHSLIGKSGK